MKNFDLCGLRCPMTIDEINRIVSAHLDGEEFAVTVDDPTFEPEMSDWIRGNNHEVVEQSTQAGLTRTVIRVRQVSPSRSDS